MKLIKVTKVADCIDAVYPDNHSIGTSHTGRLCSNIEIGLCIIITKEGFNYFQSSTVRELLTDNRVKTHDSIYQIEYLE